MNLSPQRVVANHLREIEKGNWDEAMKYIADDYKTTGVIPFPISLFVKLGKKQAMTMHKARKRAMPDFQFNEDYQQIEGGKVRIQVNLTGTHTGVIDYTGILRGIPVIKATGKELQLNPEWFDYYVKDGLIHRIHAKIPKNAGVKGLVAAVQN